MVDSKHNPKQTGAAEAHARSQASPRSGAPETCVGNGGRRPAGSASPSNTAPANYIGTRILHAGVDSLYLSYAGRLTEHTEAQLEHLKALAQSPEGAAQAAACLFLADQPFAVQPKGRGRFPFVLRNNHYQLQLSRRQAEKLPLAYVQVASELLTCCGLAAAVDALNNQVSVLAGKVIHPTVSRVDLCVDFITDLDLEAVPRPHWITRASSQTRYYVQGRFSGYTFGQRGPLSCRLYDKTLEIQKSQKTYLYERWQKLGWDGNQPVWRLEFQFNRLVLGELQVTSLPHLVQHLNSLWAYATQRWLQLKHPETDSNATRWPLYPSWQALQEATFNEGPRDSVLRVRKDTAPSDRALFVNGLGAITSFMAREGIGSLDEALSTYAQHAHEYHRQQSQRTGKTLPTYVREKVAQKRTRYAARSKRENLTTSQRGRS